MKPQVETMSRGFDRGGRDLPSDSAILALGCKNAFVAVPRRTLVASRPPRLAGIFERAELAFASRARTA